MSADFIKYLDLCSTSSPENPGYYTEKFKGQQTLFIKHLNINSNKKQGKRLRRNLG